MKNWESVRDGLENVIREQLLKYGLDKQHAIDYAHMTSVNYTRFIKDDLSKLSKLN